jgi:hypothetical protein
MIDRELKDLFTCISRMRPETFGILLACKRNGRITADDAVAILECMGIQASKAEVMDFLSQRTSRGFLARVGDAFMLGPKGEEVLGMARHILVEGIKREARVSERKEAHVSERKAEKPSPVMVV